MVVELGGLRQATLTGEVVHQPEAAKEKGSFLPLQPIRELVVEIAIEQPVAGAEVLLHRSGGGDHARMIGGEDAPERERQHARVERSAAELRGDGSKLR